MLKNKLKLVISFLISLSMYSLSVNSVLAGSYVAENSATLKTRVIDEKNDYRQVLLESYLNKHNSPLAGYATVFISVSDKYNLDWRLIPAITGVESTFGKRIPVGSYNAYGWANGLYKFSSWDESIEIVGKTLRTKYVDRGADTVAEIARIYAPPSNTWGRNVAWFMKKIDPVPLDFTI